MFTLKKATLFMRDDLFGAFCKLEVRDLEIGTRQYAQYPRALYVKFVVKGKRKTTGFWLTYSPFLAVYEGWNHDLEPEPFIVEDIARAVQSSRYASHDPRWQEGMLEKISNYPVAHTLLLWGSLSECLQIYDDVQVEKTTDL